MGAHQKVDNVKCSAVQTETSNTEKRLPQYRRRSLELASVQFQWQFALPQMQHSSHNLVRWNLANPTDSKLKRVILGIFLS